MKCGLYVFRCFSRMVICIAFAYRDQSCQTHNTYNQLELNFITSLFIDLISQRRKAIENDNANKKKQLRNRMNSMGPSLRNKFCNKCKTSRIVIREIGELT